MAVNLANYRSILEECQAFQALLVAVSKTKPASEITELYAAGQRDFAENYVQEFTEKKKQVPADITWHFIGHLQRNKVKLIVPGTGLIQSVDSSRLLQAINQQSAESGIQTDVLLQVHIASEESKFGLSEAELFELLNDFPQHCKLKGLMGMASFTSDQSIIEAEFRHLRKLFDEIKTEERNILSMGMSADYKIALACGSNLIRIGSALFGARDYSEKKGNDND